MSAYEPGTVAVITHDGESYRAVRDDKGWASLSPLIGWVLDSEVTDVRPLLVFDWSHPEQVVKRLRDGHMLTVLDIADQIEAQTKPPRIPEPGLWGVVEAETNFPTRRWVHHEEGRWVSDAGTILVWDDLRNPVLIREGVEP